MQTQYIHAELTSEIIDGFYTVYNKLGFGFLEKIYERALKIELENKGLNVKIQKPIKVYYNEIIIGDYYADLIVNNIVIVELKAVKTLAEAHGLQLINYLKATNLEVGLLLNFGKKAQIQRKIFTNKKPM